MSRSGAEEQHVVQLLGAQRPDSSPASRRKLPSDAPGRAGSAAAAGAPSRRAWPTAAAAEVGAGSGALPPGAAPAGCARVCGPPLQTGGRERFYDRPMGADRCALAPAGLDEVQNPARPSQPPAWSRAPRGSAAARRGAVREGRPSVTPCPSGRRSGRGAPPGGPPPARSTREPLISPPPPPSEPGGPAPSAPAARRCRRNGCRYMPPPFFSGARGFGSWPEPSSIVFRCVPPITLRFNPHSPHRPVIATPGRDLRRQGSMP